MKEMLGSLVIKKKRLNIFLTKLNFNLIGG